MQLLINSPIRVKTSSRFKMHVKKRTRNDYKKIRPLKKVNKIIRLASLIKS